MPTATTAVHREHVEAFIEDTVARGRTAATANTRFQRLRVFFAYLADEGEIDRSPMERMKAPAVPDTPVPVVRDDLLRAMLAGCSGNDFDDRRDNAILRLFIDTGLRLPELTSLHIEDVDFDNDVAVVPGKGHPPRACPFGAKTGQALDRYLKLRARRPERRRPELWLGKKGPVTFSGIRQVIKRRSREAPVAQVRVARPTDRFDEAVRFYRQALGRAIIDGFEDHDGCTGVMPALPAGGSSSARGRARPRLTLVRAPRAGSSIAADPCGSPASWPSP